MRGWAVVLGLTILAASCAGCGTLNNLPPPDAIIWTGAPRPSPRAYGGVRSEVAWLVDSKSDPEYALPGMAVKALSLPAVLIDLPLTVVGDTLTLPYTLAYGCGFFGRIAMNAPPSVRRVPSDQDGSDAFTLKANSP